MLSPNFGTCHRVPSLVLPKLIYLLKLLKKIKKKNLMHHIYHTEGIVLEENFGEAEILLYLYSICLVTASLKDTEDVFEIALPCKILLI